MYCAALLVLEIEAEEAWRSTAKPSTLANPLRNKSKKVNMMKTPEEAITIKRKRLNDREFSGLLYGKPSISGFCSNVIFSGTISRQPSLATLLRLGFVNVDGSSVD